MPTSTKQLDELISREYRHGFYTTLETDTVPRGLNEDIIRIISARKSEPKFMLEWRLKAYRHWLTKTEPQWANVHHPAIVDFTRFIERSELSVNVPGCGLDSLLPGYDPATLSA